ncbi:MAG TPA: menaquinone biosynthesis protein [Holophaga sp.]|nr:menaquinone biosynthesis protein [Holophaga sp.]
MAIRPFRLSIIEYLNAAPLNLGFKRGLGKDLFEMRFQVPSACADSLRQGQVDAGLISSIEYLRIPQLSLVPGLCIASPQRVRSVLLLSKVPPASIRSLALDTSSRTSAALARILLRERFHSDPVTTDMGPDLPTMLAGNDAALMIGDAAMRAPKDGLLVLDLAEEWHSWTGLPFVFALWMVHPDAPKLPGPGGTASYFHQSLALGQAHLETLVDEAERSVGWTRQELRDYFTRNIHYALGEPERASLVLFFSQAVRHGLAPALQELRFLDFPSEAAPSLPSQP